MKRVNKPGWCARLNVAKQSTFYIESQKYPIGSMLNVEYKLSEIALAMGKDNVMVRREMKRNGNQRSDSYSHDLGQRKHHKRQKEKPKRACFTTGVKMYVNALLHIGLENFWNLAKYYSRTFNGIKHPNFLLVLKGWEWRFNVGNHVQLVTQITA